MCCDGDITARNRLVKSVTAKWIDCTGGQAAFKDGDLETFGKELVDAARSNNIELYCIYRMYDPGVGLFFASWWVQGGIDAGVFQEYKITNAPKRNTKKKTETKKKTCAKNKKEDDKNIFISL
jgi:hypothetical protein